MHDAMKEVKSQSGHRHPTASSLRVVYVLPGLRVCVCAFVCLCATSSCLVSERVVLRLGLFVFVSWPNARRHRDYSQND